MILLSSQPITDDTKIDLTMTTTTDSERTETRVFPPYATTKSTINLLRDEISGGWVIVRNSSRITSAGVRSQITLTITDDCPTTNIPVNVLSSAD